ncbi:MAG: GHKL domain-containing protein [Nitrososphaeraceae archaeon]|nr:GHKL domain-containing protein [Nitrososphaeraceae archaeon]
MNFPKRFREIGIISIILIVSLSYGLYFILQDLTEDSIKTSLFEQQRLRQLDTNNAISQHVASDIDSILSKLKVVANSIYVQQGSLTENKTEQILQEMYNETRQLVGKADNLFIVDRNGTIALIASDQESQRTLVGTDISFRDYANQTKTTLEPVFSTGFLSLDGIYRIVITQPIINRETGQYQGFVGAGIPTVDFFKGFGNVYDIKSQYLAALDRNATHLVHSNTQLIGKDFFGEYTQNFTRHNDDLNNLMKKVVSGRSGDVVYSIGLGERLTTGFPISIHEDNETGIPPYVAFIVTPTSQIYSQIESILFTQRIETFSLLAITTAAAIILIVFLIKWSSNLDIEVKRRTRELESANEQLKVHDNMQKEFINIAAHELRTPTQSIMGYSELLATDPENSTRYINPIIRNANRLQRLSEDILDVTRIESQSLKLNREEFNLDDVISSIVGDYRTLLLDDEDKINLDIQYEPKSIIVNADKVRVSQVISNLLSNAIKFTTKGKGTIYVTAEKKNSEVMVSVKDTGQGIDPEILPRLFTKFVTKSSSSGTGLGLFISKSIVETHGGKIWAENSTDGRGVTFSFTLPVV